VKVINVRAEERRITLSLRQMQLDEERREFREYQRGRGGASDRTTIGDVVGDLAAKMRRSRRERRERERVDLEDYAEEFEELEEIDADELAEGPEEAEISDEGPTAEQSESEQPQA